VRQFVVVELPGNPFSSDTSQSGPLPPNFRTKTFRAFQRRRYIAAVFPSHDRELSVYWPTTPRRPREFGAREALSRQEREKKHYAAAICPLFHLQAV
jgi:hypothetical protein